MWKQLCRIQLRPHNVRTFLSDAYKCTAEWQARLDTPVLQQIKLDTFFYELDRKFQTHGKICAIDLDIFANKINDSSHLEELTDLVHRLRLTEETSNALDSTSHAVIRHYLDFGTKTIEDLVKILDDRLGYGVFFDTYTANLLLDHFLKAKNYRLAAHMATLLMLQEDFSNDISRTLSLYSCYKFVQNPVPFEEPIKVEPVAVAEEEKPKAKTAKGKKKTEELRVRVRFIRNEYFDDHFDIKNSEHLVGKTLIAISRQTEGTLANSVALIGSCFYQKYEEGLKFLETIAKTNDIHNEAVEIVKNHLTKAKGVPDGDEPFTKFSAEIQKLSESQNLIGGSLEEAITKLTTDAVAKNEINEIEEQKKIYALWCQIRETKLNEELERLKRFERLQEIERITEEMSKTEEKLWFFENEEKINIKIERAEVRNKQNKKDTDKSAKSVEDSYIPPEVGRHQG